MGMSIKGYCCRPRPFSDQGEDLPRSREGEGLRSLELPFSTIVGCECYRLAVVLHGAHAFTAFLVCRRRQAPPQVHVNRAEPLELLRKVLLCTDPAWVA